MATRSAEIPPGVAVNITLALALEDGRSYLLELGPDAYATDSVTIALGADPETVGGHALSAGDRGRFIRQSPATWFARHFDEQGRASQLSATESDDCS